ncbi:hypothetical protein DPMN_176633 [Dreissena polymorpha]|uniref:Uncharacterized protein n=1 Tax=Dreissena polymorpha TaxID=45954 RepID=A0A9D4IKT1_DREPO|nr:hypothetical protein DPMN_176633 [Dreissena polymorpha]
MNVHFFQIRHGQRVFQRPQNADTLRQAFCSYVYSPPGVVGHKANVFMLFNRG